MIEYGGQDGRQLPPALLQADLVRLSTNEYAFVVPSQGQGSSSATCKGRQRTWSTLDHTNHSAQKR